MEIGKQLIDELMDLWFECSQRCDRIEKMIKQLNEKKKN